MNIWIAPGLKEINDFLEWADKPGPWSEEDDKIHTVGGLTNDKDKSFMKFQNKIDKKERKSYLEGEIYNERNDGYVKEGMKKELKKLNNEKS